MTIELRATSPADESTAAYHAFACIAVGSTFYAATVWVLPLANGERKYIAVPSSIGAAYGLVRTEAGSKDALIAALQDDR